MHVQCAHITSPHSLMATQACNDGKESFWECFTAAVNKKNFLVVYLTVILQRW